MTGNRPGDAEQQGSGDVSAAAGMLDGRFVVVYTEDDGNGDVDIEARIFDTRSAEDPNIARDAGGPPASRSARCSMTSSMAATARMSCTAASATTC